MKEAAAILDKKRLFASTLMNDNLLDCILSKVKIIEKAPGVCSFFYLYLSYITLLKYL